MGTWRLLQLRKGHRFSTDDLVTAWMAWRSRPNARRLLDLGSGLGSVGLTTLFKLTHGRPRADWPALTTVEAQALSVGLARRSIRINGLDDVVTALHGDLRTAPLPEGATFDLITGSPPYFPIGTALLSPHPQKSGARMELRGSVIDYAAAAARWLAPTGRFVYVMLANDPRTEAAAPQAGLAVERSLSVVFGAGRAPQIVVLVCGHAEDVSGPRVEEELVIRGDDGEWTEAYLAFRHLFAPDYEPSPTMVRSGIAS